MPRTVGEGEELEERAVVEPLPPLLPPERAAVERVVLRAALLRRVVVVAALTEALDDAAGVEAVTGVTSMVV